MEENKMTEIRLLKDYWRVEERNTMYLWPEPGQQGSVLQWQQPEKA